jgi:hypothetical protein
MFISFGTSSIVVLRNLVDFLGGCGVIQVVCYDSNILAMKYNGVI